MRERHLLRPQAAGRTRRVAADPAPVAAAPGLPPRAGSTRQPSVERADAADAIGLFAYLRSGSLKTLVTIPFIYSLILPIAVLDLWVSVYQWLCFPLYRIAIVRRREHVVIDRYRLPYLNALEKVNCVFCGYATGVLAYANEIAARTEQYWCPIRHRRAPGTQHHLYPGFSAFGDGRAHRQGLLLLRARLQPKRRGSRTSEPRH
jgi:hypothetical protein